MTWGNPWAWFGLAALAVPLLIHMLGRRQAKAMPLPTLRFLEASRLQPVRRTRVQDLALLALRLLILALAVAALAQPLFRTDARSSAAAGLLSRVVIVDTSASMVRDAADPASPASPASAPVAVDVARREAERLVAEAESGIVVETVSPASAFAGAAAWLGTRPGTTEIVVISDFQAGALDSLDIARVPEGPGIRLHRVAIATADPVGFSFASGDRLTSANVRLAADSIGVEWSVRQLADPSLRPQMLVAAADTAAAAAAFGAARSLTAGFGFDGARPIAVAYEGYDGLDALLQAARPIDVPWMADMVREIAMNGLLRDATEAAIGSDRLPVARNHEGRVPIGAGPHTIALGGAAIIDGEDHLVLFVSVEPGSLASAALLAAAGQAGVHRPPVHEVEPAVLSDGELATLERQPAERVAAPAATDASDARWFWLAVLGLLGVEWLVRRRSDPLRAAAGATASP